MPLQTMAWESQGSGVGALSVLTATLEGMVMGRSAVVFIPVKVVILSSHGGV